MTTRSLQKLASRTSGPEPAGGFPVLEGGLPVIGHLYEMYRSFPELCARGAAAHGPNFYIEAGPGVRQLMCTAPTALQVLKHSAASTSFYAEGFSALLEGTLFALDGDEHRGVRQAITPPFTPQRVRRSDVVSIVVDAHRRRIDSWLRRREFDVVTETREIALEIIFRILGVPPVHLPQWERQYNRYLVAGLPANVLKGPLYWYAIRARTWIDEHLGAMVDELRASGDGSTLAGAMANARGEDGRLLERDAAVRNLRVLVFAGHETTASAIAWSTLHLASSNELQQRAVAEVQGMDDLGAVATDGARFTFAEAMFREALRLYPPVHSVIRRARGPIDLDGATIPENTLVNIPIVHLLREPARFPNPGRFDADRWIERPRPGTVETAMFGGGPHFCLGYHIAITEGTLFNLLLARALHRNKLVLERVDDGPVPTPTYLPLTHPPRNTMMRFVPSSRNDFHSEGFEHARYADQ
ncbi:MAG: cytochrome P450 [Polyangiaceae bacterium]|nr:cytochrome P450 [Polyangiaceae bacterium]